MALNPEGGMTQLETLIELRFLNSSFLSSNFSVRAFRACPPVKIIKKTVPCRAIRGNSISVNSTLSPLSVSRSARRSDFDGHVLQFLHAIHGVGGQAPDTMLYYAMLRYAILYYNILYNYTIICRQSRLCRMHQTYDLRRAARGYLL